MLKYVGVSVSRSAIGVRSSTRCLSLVRGFHCTAPSNASASDSPEQRREQRMRKIISKSKLMTRLSTHPRFEKYFARLSESGTIPTVTSFFILHEITAIVPLFAPWYLFYTFPLMENWDLSQYELLSRCNDAIERLVGDRYGQFEKHRLILTGAVAYSLVKLLGPVRIFISLWGAPYMGRYLTMPFQKLASARRK
ncbi:Mrx11p KNAG_0A02230 [Huiozyma naganishii CBS 8797]|uniref:Uncharacterized protein n=1 Tax=Huiozyma naganishii (strain ATCC MYA-139 / BCRC 22969 / CBS 8797 / KCTC 17520 / NBRC 10181 / NCYC 3082 / Yp74L-3) TaxID=1071383 RepID=J7RT75_HUIN7|nr:hypothetical protein KNAG_0A02230 [Kazachstania naganishii CBS 8797]CCK67912.1 hypothetical protein KNAG_0A02230 [Kazachstania naganishii CBS 8797]